MNLSRGSPVRTHQYNTSMAGAMFEKFFPSCHRRIQCCHLPTGVTTISLPWSSSLDGKISHFRTLYLGNDGEFRSFLFFIRCALQKSSKVLNFNPLRQKLDFSEAKNHFFFGPCPLWALGARPMTHSRTSTFACELGIQSRQTMLSFIKIEQYAQEKLKIPEFFPIWSFCPASQMFLRI